MRGIIFLMALSFAVCVQAAEDYPDLPPPETVLQALSNAPGVQAARSGVSLSEASRTRLEAGPYEPNVRLNTQQRNVSNGPSYNEWSVSVERGLRLPGKAQLDQQLGAQGVTQAQFAYGDAWHEAGREVLHLWFTWMREHAQRRDWQHQVDTLTQQADVVRKRVQSGDAAQLELSLAEAAVSQAEQNLQQADQREQAALIGLTRRYPGIQPPERPVLTDPQPLTESLEAWRARILAGNHELQWVRSETQRAQLQAARTGRDRVPDPTLGVHYGSEQGGDEHIAGLFISIPITGAARAAAESEARAQAEIASSNEARVVRRLDADIATTYSNAQASYRVWESARGAAQALQKNADLMLRAYSLGEAGLSEVLNARRLAIEARLSASLAQLDANEARYRLLLDAHQLWALHEDHAEQQDTP